MITPYKNTQEAIELAAYKLGKQGKRSFCYYRTSNLEMKCGIGHLIPDEIYKEEFEGNSISSLLDNFENIKILFKNCDPYALARLQKIHDSYLFSDFRILFESEFVRYGLDASKIIKAFDRGTNDRTN